LQAGRFGGTRAAKLKELLTMRRAVKAFILSATVAIVCVPSTARADGYVAPFVGVNFNNNAGNGRGSFGVGVGWMGAGIAGVDFDLGYGPNFFGSQGGFGDNHVLTAMANLIVGVPLGGTYGSGIRPYGTFGVGVVQTRVTGTPGPAGVPHIADNDFGLNGGLGLMGFFSQHAGIRGEVRYFRNFRDTPPNTLQFGAFRFWRASIGVVLRP